MATAPAQQFTSADDLGPSVEQEEVLTDLIRLRKAFVCGMCLWPLFFSTDYLLAAYVKRGTFAGYASIRLAEWLCMAAGTIAVRRYPPTTRAALVAYDAFLLGTACFSLGFMCVVHGGLASPYAAGIPVALIVRSSYLATPWRSALWPVGIAGLAYPICVVAATLYQGGVARLLRDPAELSLFALYTAMIWTTVAATILGGHAVWALRRRVFEARNLGRYKLLRPLARGGMGEVWVARHLTLRREVAVKILRPDRLTDVALQRFEREVEATSELAHPNTIRVFDYGVTEDGLRYYAMELLDGEDLARTVAREGPLAPDRSVHILLQVSGALAEAHARGIVHRDIKPENVFLCRAGGLLDFVKVLDFGIAKRDDRAPARALTNFDRMLGTPAYVSPEVAVGHAADARSDVYGLGGLLYFLLAGAPPFEGSESAMLVAHAVQAPERPSARLGAALPAELEAVVMRCLRKEPRERYADASELHKELSLLARGEAKNALRQPSARV